MATTSSGRDRACKGSLLLSLKKSFDSNSPTTPSPTLTATKLPDAAMAAGGAFPASAYTTALALKLATVTRAGAVPCKGMFLPSLSHPFANSNSHAQHYLYVACCSMLALVGVPA